MIEKEAAASSSLPDDQRYNGELEEHSRKSLNECRRRHDCGRHMQQVCE